MIKTPMGWFWGSKNENGFWFASSSSWKWLAKKEKIFDALYIALWRCRIRILRTN